MDDQNCWNEETSQDFIINGDYLVPQRQLQFRILCSLLSDLTGPCQIIDLCCGEGRLAEMLLESLPEAVVHGLDGSPEMLRLASTRLARFGSRFIPRLMNLPDRAWRSPAQPVDAIVSSLAVHHLEAPQKQALFVDLYGMLNKGGRIVIADITYPPGAQGKRIAAQMWDESVKARSLELDGNTSFYDFFVRENWNIFRNLDPDDIDKPSPLYDQLKWLEAAGFVEVDVHWMQAGHAIFSARKSYSR